jgi:perosamine synthetase
MNPFKYPVYKPSLSGNESLYINDCINSTWISSKGKYIDKFENNFKDYLKIDYATSVSNGTTALHLALLALDIGPGDEVIVPTLTYIASVNAIAYVGAKPVFVDSNLNDWNIDTDKIEEKVTNRTKALMAVHLYGASCNMASINSICKKNKILLVEDAAEGFGSMFNNEYAGSFGDISTFSFFGNKTITTGEGGMVTSKSEKLIKKVKYLKNQAISSDKEYWHDHIGYNYRMTNICAAIGLAQLERANKIINKKRKIAEWYKEELKGFDVVFQNEELNTKHSFWMVAILLKNNIIRDAIREKLMKVGVETRPIFYPIHTMPSYLSNKKYPVAETLNDRGLNLPSYPDLDKADINFICEPIKLFLKKIN